MSSAKRHHLKKPQLHFKFKTPHYLKFKKYFQVLIKYKTTINKLTLTILQYGQIGLQAIQAGYLTLKQLEMLKKFLKPFTKNRSLILSSVTNL
jgi:hypothetical protein